MSKRYCLKSSVLYLFRGNRNLPVQIQNSKTTGIGFCFLFFIYSIVFFSFSVLSDVNFTKDKCYHVFSQKRIKSRVWMSYKEAKELIRTQNVKTFMEFRKWRKSQFRPFNFPTRPEDVYKGEWKNWPEFLGTNWMGYEEAKQFIQAQGIRTSIEFRKWCQLGLRPVNFPSKPYKVYKEEWKGWPEFLGTNWMGHEEAKQFIQAQGIRTSIEFQKWRQSGLRPVNFPTRPYEVYKEEWKNWPEFLGTNWMSYEEAKQLIQKEGITSTGMFSEWKKAGYRPFNFPSSPDTVYKEEWISWGSFFGTGRKRRESYKQREKDIVGGNF